MVLYTRLWMYEATLVRDRAITPDEHVVCYRLPEHLDFEDVSDDLLGFTVNIWVDKGDIVVACNDVSER